MTSADILGNHHSIRSALWLYLDLLASTKLIDARFMPVAEGIAITDEQLAYRLDGHRTDDQAVAEATRAAGVSALASSPARVTGRCGS